jgi:hypothetical protein
MSHYEIDNDNMHPLEFLLVNVFFVVLGNAMIAFTTEPIIMQVPPLDIWEMIHKAGYLVPFIGLFINQRKTIFGWFKKKKR